MDAGIYFRYGEGGGAACRCDWQGTTKKRFAASVKAGADFGCKVMGR